MINWYPSHIAKSKINIKKQLPFIDLVIEMIDARLPYTSHFEDLDALIKNKHRIILLNKTDLADEKKTAYWMDFYKQKGFSALRSSINDNNSINNLKACIKKQTDLIIEKLKQKRILRNTIRTIVVGIPNVGKSSLINKLVKRKVVSVANKPGLTRQTQWIRIGKEIELLDTPGLFFPEIKKDEQKELKFILIGALPLEMCDMWNTALNTIELLKKLYPDFVTKELGESAALILSASDKQAMLILWGQKKNFKTKGDTIDKQRTAKAFIQYIQNGKFGRFSFE